MKKQVWIAALLGCGLTGAAHAGATWAGAGKITRIENGWLGEGVVVHFTGPGVPGCAGGPTNLAIGSDHPGYREVVAIALTAFSSGSNVEIVVDQGACIFGNRTKVLAITLVKAA